MPTPKILKKIGLRLGITKDAYPAFNPFSITIKQRTYHHDMMPDPERSSQAEYNEQDKREGLIGGRQVGFFGYTRIHRRDAAGTSGKLSPEKTVYVDIAFHHARPYLQEALGRKKDIPDHVPEFIALAVQAINNAFNEYSAERVRVNFTDGDNERDWLIAHGAINPGRPLVGFGQEIDTRLDFGEILSKSPSKKPIRSNVGQMRYWKTGHDLSSIFGHHEITWPEWKAFVDRVTGYPDGKPLGIKK